MRKGIGTAGALVALTENTKFERIIAKNVYAEWITCGDVYTDKYLCSFMMVDTIKAKLMQHL